MGVHGSNFGLNRNNKRPLLNLQFTTVFKSIKNTPRTCCVTPLQTGGGCCEVDEVLYR